MKKWKRKTSAIMKITCAFLILISCFGIINLFTATTTLSNIEEAWDGVEVATSFSGGNGTKENPYQISSGSELAYLKQIVEQNSFHHFIKICASITDNRNRIKHFNQQKHQNIHIIAGKFQMFFCSVFDCICINFLINDL